MASHPSVACSCHAVRPGEELTVATVQPCMQCANNCALGCLPPHATHLQLVRVGVEARCLKAGGGRAHVLAVCGQLHKVEEGAGASKGVRRGAAVGGWRDTVPVGRWWADVAVGAER